MMMTLQVSFVMTSAFFAMLTPFSENMDMTLQNMTISAKKSVNWEDSCKPSAKGLQS